MITYMKKLLGDNNQKQLRKYSKIVEEINHLEEKYEEYTDEELRNKTSEFKDLIDSGISIDQMKSDAFAVVREASKRVLGQRHYDVQLIGGLVLAEGNIAEMPTGEGKTLVASLPSYLRALEGKGVHIITVNDYLARRDKELIGQIHEYLGLSVGLNVPDMNPEDKQKAYKADITYGVGNEFGFDYLRDHMVSDPKQRVQRSFHYAIIDEIDSVLIDEAKTPLIIAGKTEVNANIFNVCTKLVKRFIEGTHYYFDPETKATNLTDAGINMVESAFGVDNLYDLEHQSLYHYMIQCLRAHVMFTRDVDYIVKEGKILLVDQFTGRVMDGRSYGDGLHQAIESKEGLIITEENKTQSTITIQNYFRMYPVLSGMTGTAMTEKVEFQQLYEMDVIQVPTNKPRIRIDHGDLVFSTKEDKYEALTNKVTEIHRTGQPILIGTTSIQQSERVAECLNGANLTFNLLNAKSVEMEVKLISLAGQRDQITIATNMAGRGTDIMLGEGVAELGGLFILGTEKHESRRIDNQLIGRAGRQGDPGASQFFISLDDDIFKRFAEKETSIYKSKMKTNSNGLIQNKDINEFVTKVQKICEGSNYSMREYTLILDNVVNEQRGIIYQLRNNILDSKDLYDTYRSMLEDSIRIVVETYCMVTNIPEEWDIDNLTLELQQLLSPSIDLSDDYEDIDDIHNSLVRYITSHLEIIDQQMMDNENPIKQVMLSTVDQHWIRHLESMNRLKEGIGLRGYSQEDPNRIYQREGYEIFTKTYKAIQKDICIRSKLISMVNQQQGG